MNAYLGWPLRLKLLQQGMHAVEMKPNDAHVTLKYLGDTSVTLGELALRLKPLETSFVPPRTWKPEVFGGLAYVMAFDEPFDPALLKLRASVEDLKPDDYPSWRPHVTFEKGIWSFISQGNLRPDQVIERVGPLALYVDGRAIHTFRRPASGFPSLSELGV